MVHYGWRVVNMLQQCAPCANVRGMETNADDGTDDGYHGWSLAEALKSVEQIESINQLRILCLSEEEADEFWHSIHD